LFPAATLGRLAVAGAAFAVALLVVFGVFQTTMMAEGPKPRFAITPGETRAITLEEVCLYEKAEVISQQHGEHQDQQHVRPDAECVQRHLFNE